MGLITLLSCLEKRLKRLSSKRMSHFAITSDIIARQHFGALSKYSATDLVSCLVHCIEKAKTQGWAFKLVILEIEGAFDGGLGKA